jgi:DUF971 family protein
MATPSGIEKIGLEKLRIVWDDGHVSDYSFHYLRENCPCALCRDEFSGRMILDLAMIPTDITSLRESVVGHYGIAFSFSDEHGTGIYTFDGLRKLCPCAECENGISTGVQNEK